MRTIKEIIIHCTATKEGQAFTVNDVRKWHVKGNGWKDIGYHYLIGINGEIWEGRKEDVVGAHCSGHNSYSIGVCYVGGLDKAGKPKDTRTDAQKESLVKIVSMLHERYKNAKIYGHNDFAKKACPCFNAKEEYSHITK